AVMLNNYCNPTDPLSFNEVKQVCQSISKWTWRNFSTEKFSAIQSYRASKKRSCKKSKDTEDFFKNLGV
ncbi:primase C-terminal domain-containing protein, partial [Enterococcus faecalis]